ncbi:MULTISPECIES: N-acetyltransferase [Halorussus]|uniref:GNAT family N-acetyltransferase n=1 Tax=Halorussus TaxID=1070314 RepID=UPI000E212F4E|nr:MULTISPECIES: N-acetyltransferase [Halorussus]NHN61142.1 GNAT family N-acetyltransferase [Halorussus sp. JP-T4]
MDGTNVRPATTDDVGAVRRVARESWHAAYDGLLGAETVDAVVDDWYDPERLARPVEREDGVFLVAEADESTDSGVVGFAQGVVGDGDDPAELPRIYVSPDRWGGGVGSALLARVEDRLADRGADRLRLVVLADNEVGNGFYEKHGYRVVGERESELAGRTVTDYVREKEL